MADHFSVLAWRIPWTEEPGRLQSMGSQTVGHDWSDLAGSRQHIVELDYLNKISLIFKIKYNNYRKVIKAK